MEPLLHAVLTSLLMMYGTEGLARKIFFYFSKNIHVPDISDRLQIHILLPMQSEHFGNIFTIY
jgi:hypothetical protein